MPNQSLVDLTERTATAGSDLIHVNSGGSDYKQTKENFLQGDLYHFFDNTSLLTTQIDALPSMGTFFGRIASFGSQSVTGVPVNSNGDVFVQKFNGNFVVVDFHPIGNSDATYRKCKNSGTWESSWTQLPSRSEISALNNSLTNWNYYQVGSNSYGVLECRYNPSLKLCFMVWRGNSTAPSSAQYSFTLPSSPVLTPNDNVVAKLRNGDSMEVRTDNTVKVNLTGTSWSGGSLMYPTR